MSSPNKDVACALLYFYIGNRKEDNKLQDPKLEICKKFIVSIQTAQTEQEWVAILDSLMETAFTLHQEWNDRSIFAKLFGVDRPFLLDTLCAVRGYLLSELNGNAKFELIKNNLLKQFSITNAKDNPAQFSKLSINLANIHDLSGILEVVGTTKNKQQHDFYVDTKIRRENYHYTYFEELLKKKIPEAKDLKSFAEFAARVSEGKIQFNAVKESLKPPVKPVAADVKKETNEAKATAVSTANIQTLLPPQPTPALVDITVSPAPAPAGIVPASTQLDEKSTSSMSKSVIGPPPVEKDLVSKRRVIKLRRQEEENQSRKEEHHAKRKRGL